MVSVLGFAVFTHLLKPRLISPFTRHCSAKKDHEISNKKNTQVSPKYMKLFPVLIFVASTMIFAGSVDGSISGSSQLLIDFTNREDATAKATWANPDRISITAKGLGWDAQAAETIDGWIQSKPLAVGLSWRAASSVSLRVTIEPTPKPILLNSGQTSTPYIGQVYARFSPDAKHWSTWQTLSLSHPKEVTVRSFAGRMSVPQRERTEYANLIEAYSKLDVPWADDEEAIVKWLLERDANFFERSLPFIGYVEFLFEAPLYGGQRITSLKADVSFGMSGLHRVAKDPKAATNRDVPWRFKANNAIAEQDGADQPATAEESKSEGREKPKPESEGRSQ